VDQNPLLLIIKQVNNSRISIWERIGKLVYPSFLYKQDNYFSLYLRKVHICVVKFHYDPVILSLVLSYTECKQNYRAKSHSFRLNQSLNCLKKWISAAPNGP